MSRSLVVGKTREQTEHTAVWREKKCVSNSFRPFNLVLHPTTGHTVSLFVTIRKKGYFSPFKYVDKGTNPLSFRLQFTFCVFLFTCPCSNFQWLQQSVSFSIFFFPEMISNVLLNFFSFDSLF